MVPDRLLEGPYRGITPFDKADRLGESSDVTGPEPIRELWVAQLINR
jgi:hypothetical protein